MRKAVTTLLPAVLVASTMTALLPGIASASGPSVALPTVASTPVAQQAFGGARPPDGASSDALHGDQPAGGASADGGGTDRATPLAPSASWSVSPQTGNFTWSYPIPVPPAPGGLEPTLALGYDSSSVDGRTSATNNQASWVGDGWDLSAGFIERAYLPCANDSMGGTTPPSSSGDLCWRSDNAVAAYSGAGGELIRDDGTGEWRARNDDGSRIEHFFGADGVSNGDDNGEYWKITSPNGTQYLFGSRPDAASTWTVPVFGDDSGEPCHAATFDASHCVQAWRWNLDKVIDAHGNVIVYNYAAEANSYGLGNKDAAVPYLRGGTLRSAEYGLRDDDATRPPTGRVEFGTADRCVPGSDCTPSKKDNWPDVPWDDKCDTPTCVNRHAPTFWSTRRLDTITTKVRNGSGWSDVDSWKLGQEFPKPGDGEKPTLWLKSITHTGLAGAPVTLPPVTFEGMKLDNRVDKVDGVGPLKRYRISAVVSETGGVTTVSYAPPQCVSGVTMPANPQTNTLRCFPMKWAKKDFSERTDYFHKYVVARITLSDRISANTEEETDYEYLDGAAWAYDDSETTKDDRRDWNVYRGYGRVRVHHGAPGDPAGPVTMTEQRFYRGMDGDKQPSGTRSVTVKDSEGTERRDDRWLAGTLFETQVHQGESDTVVSKTITTPSVQGPTATRGDRKAYLVRQGIQADYLALAAGGTRITRTEQTYDDRGILTSTNDLGDTTTAGDDRCTTVKYHRNTAKWLLNLPYETETVAAACTAAPTFPDDAVSATHTFYDHQALDDPPATGDVTRTEDLDQRPASGPVTTLVSTSDYDEYGRVTSTRDALDRTTTTAYTPATGPLTQTVVTDAAAFATTTVLDPAHGEPISVTDPNNRKTETTYDALGRRTEVWLPNRTRAPNVRGNQYFTYTYRNDAPTVVTTATIGPNGNYLTSNELYDGLLRLRQKQVAAKDGGRLITDTRYDSQGRNYKTTKPYFNSGPVDGTLWLASDVDVPLWTITEFDGVGRAKTQTTKAGTEERTKATLDYGGDRVTLTPPQGSTAMTVIADARGRIVEQRQYHGTTPQGAFDSTKYGYDKAGRLATLTDPVGQLWRHTYDLHGRETVNQDPDKGATTLTYDAAGQVATSTDARGTTLAFGYDNLGRRTSEQVGSLTGPTLAAWTFDTASFGKGLPATATRYVNGVAYTTTEIGYDALNRSIGTTLSIPATPTEPGFTGSYTSYRSYKVDGSVRSTTYAALPGLPAEPVSYTYNDLGQLTGSSGGYDGNTFSYGTDTQYTRYGEVERIQLGDPGKRAWLSRYYDQNTRQLKRSIVDAELPSPMQADVNYTYDPSGNITSIVDNAPGQSDRQCFRYDYLQRLTEAWTPGDDCTADPSVSALTGVAPYWQSFGYDTIGNRLQLTQHAAAGDTVQKSTYPAAGQPHAHRLDSVSTTGPGVSKTEAFTYDANGNTATRTGQTLDWDAEGHLAKVTQGGNVTEFVYGAGGNRLLRRDPTGSTLYLDGQELRLNKANGAVSATRYYQHGGTTVAMRNASGLIWLAGDHQGTAQLAINSSTLQVTRRRQTPFGGPRGAAVSFPGEQGFVGGTNDPSTGLVHLGAREYDPTLGRFLSVDPVRAQSDAQQLQGYTYSNNSPVTKMDPSGRNWFGDLVSWTATALSIACVVALAATGAVPVLLVAATAAVTVVDMFVAANEGDNATVAIDLVGLAVGGVGGGIAKVGAEAFKGAAEGFELTEKVATNVGALAGVGAAGVHSEHKAEEWTEERREAKEFQDRSYDEDVRMRIRRNAKANAQIVAEQQAKAQAAAYQGYSDYLNAGPDRWPITADRSPFFGTWTCVRAGGFAGPYPCDAANALLVNPRTLSFCHDHNPFCVPPVPRNSPQRAGLGQPNLGWGRKANHDGPQPAPGTPVGGGYRVTGDGRYQLTNGHGYLMS